jgi:hypothetical protein
MCIHVSVQRNHSFCKAHTQKMVAKVNNLRTEEKPSFMYLRICVSGQRNHSLKGSTCAPPTSPLVAPHIPSLPHHAHVFLVGCCVLWAQGALVIAKFLNRRPVERCSSQIWRDVVNKTILIPSSFLHVCKT